VKYFRFFMISRTVYRYHLTIISTAQRSHMI